MLDAVVVESRQVNEVNEVVVTLLESLTGNELTVLFTNFDVSNFRSRGV